MLSTSGLPQRGRAYAKEHRPLMQRRNVDSGIILRSSVRIRSCMHSRRPGRCRAIRGKLAVRGTAVPESRQKGGPCKAVPCFCFRFRFRCRKAPPQKELFAEAPRLSINYTGGRGSVRGNRQGSHLAQQSPARRRQKWGKSDDFPHFCFSLENRTA